MQQEINIVRSLYYPVRTDQFARLGHRTIATQNHILIFGGISPNGEYNPSIIKIDCETMTLDLVHSINSLRLQNFSLFAYNGQIYFWGGSAPKRDDPRVSVCQRKLLKFDANQFVLVQQRGSVPSARECHASCMVSNKYLIIMGGCNGKSFFNDWYILECNTMTWSALQLEEQIPPYLDPQLFWNCGRGFLLTGDYYDANTRTLCPGNKLYQFRFKDFREKKVDLEVINVSVDCKQRRPRGTPSAVLVNLESPYIMLIGGSYLTDKGQLQICNQIECFNLETLEWFTINSAIKSGLGFESIYSNQKIYLIGGVTKNREITQFIEYIELKIDYLESKVCKVCREVYGMKQYNIGDRSTLAIKIQADSSQKTFFSSQIIGRMASYISYPFSALGLLIDNSLNLSGTNIDITFDFEFYDKIEDERQKGLFIRQKSVPYNYISIIDNSFGFTQHQILECLNSFTIKTEKLTSDKRFEEEIEIRKEYGMNLKLGALRLGNSCLYMTRTEDRSKLFAYFSVSTYYSSTPFTVYTYIISPQGTCSSQINRKLIRQNVRGRIPSNYEDISAPTLLFIFDIKRIELSIKKEEGYGAVYYRESGNKIFRELGEYVSSLYLNPYTGRRIAINGKDIKFRSYLQTFKKDQQIGALVEVDEEDYPKELFSCFYLYKVQAQNYFLNSILCYQKNRLLFPVTGVDSRFCGVVELSEHVKVDICKTKIQYRNEQLLINRIIRSIIGKYELKRVSKEGIKLLQPSKERVLDGKNGKNLKIISQSTPSMDKE